MSEIDDDNKLSVETKPYIFRILNGVMAGCEFFVSTERALIIVGNDSNTNAIDPLSTLPCDTFIVPNNGDAFNFEIIINDGESRTLLVRELNQDVSHETSINFNERHQINGFIFAVKEENDEWDKTVLGLPQFVEPTAPRISKRVLISAICIIVFCISLIGYIFISFNNSDETQQKKLDRILVNNDKEYVLLKGRNGIFYIFVENQRASLWVLQSVKRGDFSSPIRVFYPSQESDRITQWLATHYDTLRFVRLQLDTPQNPVLIASPRNSRTTLPELKKIEEDLLNIIPYASNVVIKIMEDEKIIKEAQDGLNAIGLSYSYNKEKSLTNFLISGNLNDSQLQRLQRFVTGFYHKWGGELVKFNVELEDDPLHSDSVSYGEMKYLKSGSNRWNFNTNRQHKD